MGASDFYMFSRIWRLSLRHCKTSKFQLSDRRGLIRSPLRRHRALAAVSGEPKGALIVNPDSFTVANRGLIISLAARYRLPAVYPYKFDAVDGGLLSYGHDSNNRFSELVDRVGAYA